MWIFGSVTFLAAGFLEVSESLYKYAVLFSPYVFPVIAGLVGLSIGKKMDRAQMIEASELTLKRDRAKSRIDQDYKLLREVMGGVDKFECYYNEFANIQYQLNKEEKETGKHLEETFEKAREVFGRYPKVYEESLIFTKLLILLGMEKSFFYLTDMLSLIPKMAKEKDFEQFEKMRATCAELIADLDMSFAERFEAITDSDVFAWKNRTKPDIEIENDQEEDLEENAEKVEDE